MEKERELRCGRYAQTLAQMIRCETVSVKGDVNPEHFRPFHQLLRDLFPNLFAKLETEEWNGSLLMRWPGKSSAHPLMLMSHHDVVEADGKWTHPPFGGEIIDGKLWGRGTLDTKNSLWAMLQAAEELAAAGYVPEHDVWFESACTEETDGSGADAITASLKERGIRFAMVLDEGGYILHDPIGGADHDFAVVGVGEKGCADLKFIARSSGGHASTPGKNTSLVRLGSFMAAADKSCIFKAKINAVTEELLFRCSPYMKGPLAFLFRNVRFFKPLLTKLMPSVSGTAAAMLKTTLAFTMAGGSQGSNVLPAEAWVVGNMRYSHHQGQQASFEAARALAQKYQIDMEILEPGFSSEVSDFHSKEFSLVEKAVSTVFGDVATIPYVMLGASDCRYFSRVSDNCFRFSPFRITQEQLAGIHGIDENITIDGLDRAVDFYKYMIKENGI